MKPTKKCKNEDIFIILLWKNYVAYGMRIFRKIVRTEYYIDFFRNGLSTSAVLNFHKELLGVWPATPLQDIDAFMKQKIFAVRN